jgi:hypothetical protein
MGTRSRIAIKNDDGSFVSIYCHWDGYVDHHGPLLAKHYATAEAARKLIEPGDMSSLDVPGECVYYKDRGETGVEPATSGSLSALNELTKESGGEYLYVFADGTWHVAKGGIAFFGMPADKAPGALLPLADAMKAEGVRLDD